MKLQDVSLALASGVLLLSGGLLSSHLRSVAASKLAAKPDASSTGSVVGRVRLEGPKPESARANMTSEPSCAKLHPGGAMSEDFVVGNEGTLENVVVFISDGVNEKSFDVPTEPATIEQKGCMYKPHVMAMRANQVLKIVNSDNTLHNIHPVPTNNREWNKAQPGGSTLEETFAREEIAIPVKCNVHPWMRSYIAVFKHPYFAVTGKGGSFDLSNVPPGEYTVKAWHEKLGVMPQKITVAAGETKKLEFVFKAPGH
jgi:plastocyanin